MYSESYCIVECTYIAILTGTASNDRKNLYHEKTGNHHHGLTCSRGRSKVAVNKILGNNSFL
jgi:hypothetical protein